MRGFNDAWGSWKTIWNRRRIRRMSSPASPNRSTPSNTIAPESGSTMRNTQRAVVVLPQPDSPTRLSVSPRSTANDTSETACTVPVERWNS